MKVYKVEEKEFKKYGNILQGYDFSELITVLTTLPQPQDTFVYKASEEKLESLAVFKELQNRAFGGMAMQLGYCNGRNNTLNCLEYHKNSELCIVAHDTYFLLGMQSQIEDGFFDTKNCKLFFAPAGTGIELYATTLHYCPCHANAEKGFFVANGLLRGTNGAAVQSEIKSTEDRWLFGVNKWLLAHSDAPEAKQGAAVGLRGKNIVLPV